MKETHPLNQKVSPKTIPTEVLKQTFSQLFESLIANERKFIRLTGSYLSEPAFSYKLDNFLNYLFIGKSQNGAVHMWTMQCFKLHQGKFSTPCFQELILTFDKYFRLANSLRIDLSHLEPLQSIIHRIETANSVDDLYQEQPYYEGSISGVRYSGKTGKKKKITVSSDKFIQRNQDLLLANKFLISFIKMVENNSFNIEKLKDTLNLYQ